MSAFIQVLYHALMCVFVNTSGSGLLSERNVDSFTLLAEPCGREPGMSQSGLSHVITPVLVKSTFLWLVLVVWVSAEAEAAGLLLKVFQVRRRQARLIG